MTAAACLIVLAWFADERGESIAKRHLCPESAAALRDLLDRPYDEVPE